MISRGTIVDSRYELLEQVGAGGMGTVWKARHLRLGHPVAVKFAVPQVLDAEVAARFLREAKIAASVRHRNVVDIIDFGTNEAGVPYLVMEWLEGQPLDARLAGVPPMTLREFAGALGQVLAGLAVLHDAGVVHRDVKPQNIFLVREADGETVAKIVDFGVSRLPTELSGGAEAALTMSGQIVGTPLYMSPEHLRGARFVDARSDLYSLGVVLYEALAGRPPFAADSLATLIVAISTGTPERLSDRRPDLPPSLVALVSRAMARDPSARFADARAMRSALIDAVAEAGTTNMAAVPEIATAPTLDAKTPHRERAREPVARANGGRRNGLRLAAMVLAPTILVVIGIGIVVATRGPDESHEPPAPSTPSPVGPRPTPMADVGDTDAATVSVSLTGVPSAATVSLDGAPQLDVDPLSVPRDGQAHTIEVHLDEHDPWTITHVGREDGHYEVSLERRRERRRRPARHREDDPVPPAGEAVRRPAADPFSPVPTTQAGQLVSDPGF